MQNVVSMPAVQHARTTDGVNIAYLTAGEGPTLVMMPFHANHLERRWLFSAGAWARRLSESHRVVAYDSRGQGLSPRRLAKAPTVDDYGMDLRAVLTAAEVERATLVAYGGFAHVAIRYAVENPSRVDALVLICTSASHEDWPLGRMAGVAEENWDLFVDLLGAKIPEAAKPQFRDMVNTSALASDYAGLVRAFSASDVTGVLSKLELPVLILHSLDQHWLGVDEGTKFAAMIPESQLVFLDGDVEPDVIAGTRTIASFISGLGIGNETGEGADAPGAAALSARQEEVLRLIRDGMTTREIAERLVLSERTIERHIADAYAKIGARNRAEATAYAMTHL